MVVKSKHYDFYKREVDRAIRDCEMWNDRVRLIVYTTIITETCDGRPFGWLNYTNPREPQFADFKPNDGDPPDKSWSTQRSGGLFQQQPQFWGPDVMDPYKATTSFLVGFQFADGRSAAGLAKTDYTKLPVWTACQVVQGSEFGDGSNYKRNIPYAQIVLDSDEKDFPVPNYTDFDDALNRSEVPWGSTDYDKPETNKVDSIRKSIWSIKRDVHVGIPELIRRTRDAITTAISDAARNIVNDILENKRYPYWNQEGVAPEHQGMNNLVENTFATNGRVYHPAWGNKALSDKLDLVVQLLMASQPNNPVLSDLVKKFNAEHPSQVPVISSEVTDA